MARFRSTVRWFSKDKGYGFIANPEAGGRDIFVHFRKIRVAKKGEFRTLEKGETVEFNLCLGPRGLFAQDLVRQRYIEAQDSFSYARWLAEN